MQYLGNNTDSHKIDISYRNAYFEQLFLVIKMLLSISFRDNRKSYRYRCIEFYMHERGCDTATYIRRSIAARSSLRRWLTHEMSIIQITEIGINRACFFGVCCSSAPLPLTL